KLAETPSRPTGGCPGVRKTTSSATKVSRRARSPALTASIQIECIVRISRSSDAIASLVAKRLNQQRGRTLFGSGFKPKGLIVHLASVFFNNNFMLESWFKEKRTLVDFRRGLL